MRAFFNIIENYFDDRDPVNWINDFGTPRSQDHNGTMVVEIIKNSQLENPNNLYLQADVDLPWHHDLGYTNNPVNYSAIYCVKAENAGAIQFCDMQAAYESAPKELKVQEKCLNSVEKYMSNYDHPLKFKNEKEKRIYRKKGKAYHNLIQDNYFFFSTAYTETKREKLLKEHCFQEKFITTHEYKTGDLIIFDNKRIVHRRKGTNKGIKHLLRFALNDVLSL